MERTISRFDREGTERACVGIAGGERMMRIVLYVLEKVHSSLNAQQGRQQRHQIITTCRSDHESMCQL